METSVPAPAVEKKEAKSGLLEDSSFPDPGKKASPLAVAAAAAAVAAQGGILSVLHAWRTAGVFFMRSLGFNECAGPYHLGGMLGLWRAAPLPRNPSPQEGHLQLSLENWLSQILVAGPEQGEEGGRGVILGSCLATLGCVQLAPGRCILYPESFSPLALRGLFQKVIVCQCLLAVIRGSGMEFTILGGFLANLITTEGTPRAALSHLTVPERDVLRFPRSVPVSLLGSLAGR